MDAATTVIFDDAKAGVCRIFESPVEIIQADVAPDAKPALGRMQERIDAGYHVAGYFSYELGYVLEERLADRLPSNRSIPLLWFGVFAEPPRELDSAALDRYWSVQRAYVGPLQLEWDEAAYAVRFGRVADWIRCGDVYQANLSIRGTFAFLGDARAIYRAMRERSAASHGAFIDDGTRIILSFSPESFFELNQEGRIVSRPMKGTAPRAPGIVEDEAVREALQTSAKNRAENLMIVDLIRNDLGRLAETGTVTVEDLFAIETYPTLHQMVSTVSARIRPGTTIEQMLRALFPCGSVTGAPKIRAMEILRDLEASARGVYCGSIGYFAPDGGARFNVGIRTLTLADGRGQLGIGGGVVHDSTAVGEYAECLLKARYFEASRKPIQLIETLRHDAQGYARLALHVQRLETSARAFGIPFARDVVMAALDAAGHGAEPLRVRLTLDEQGVVEVTSETLHPATRWRYVMAAHSLDSADALLCHKTSWRDLHDAEHRRAVAAFGCDEALFLNERSELCEGSRSNVFLLFGDTFLTPARDAGLLNGCLRQELLLAGQCREAKLTTADLAAADAVYFGNSLRGLVPAQPIAQPADCRGSRVRPPIA